MIEVDTETLTPRKVKAKIIADGVLNGKSGPEIAKQLGIKSKNARSIVHNSIQSDYVKAEIRRRTKGALQVWSEDEITSRIQDLGQSAKSEANRLRALEL